MFALIFFSRVDLVVDGRHPIDPGYIHDCFSYGGYVVIDRQGQFQGDHRHAGMGVVDHLVGQQEGVGDDELPAIDIDKYRSQDLDILDHGDVGVRRTRRPPPSRWS